MNGGKRMKIKSKNPSLTTLLHQGCTIEFPNGRVLRGDTEAFNIETGYLIPIEHTSNYDRICWDGFWDWNQTDKAMQEVIDYEPLIEYEHEQK